MAAEKKTPTSSVRELGERFIRSLTAGWDRAWTAGGAIRAATLFGGELAAVCCATAPDVAWPVARVSGGNLFEAADVSTF